MIKFKLFDKIKTRYDLFPEKLVFFKVKKKLTLTKIASELGFSPSQWNNYELGFSFPKFLDLIKISKYFEISESILIHTDIQTTPIDTTEESERNKESIIVLQNKIIQMQEDKIKELQMDLDNLKNTKAK
ncbi:helix-turn-helix transcriptional regulator [Flavobacterium sp.]|uniref:helix-turn-helix domain-containing protein n=1 Tax=Flavobacterium sp. TaxID=239 RepID=UPI00286F342F|nr:helix-turn-helix transcriptional regulator [Flavobacterium sp.]